MFLDPSFIASSNKEDFENCKCIICAGILLNPIECSQCRNSFCTACIEKWKEESETCPFRCKNPAYHPSTKFKHQLSQLNFFCQNGCKEIIPYDKLMNHYSHECQLLNYKEKIMDFSILIGEKVEEFNKLKGCIDYYKEIIKDLKNGAKINNEVTYIEKHPHLLKYTKRLNGWLCDVCKTHYSYGVKSYYCKECDFDFCCQCYLKKFYNLA